MISKLDSFLGFNIKARHELLLAATGVTFPQEDYSYWLATTLSWALPLAIFIGAFVDATLAYTYMRYAHPWKGIVIDEEAKKAKKMKNEKKKARYFMRRHFPVDFL